MNGDEDFCIRYGVIPFFFTYHNLQYLYSICSVTTNPYGNKLSYAYHMYIILFYATIISPISQLRLLNTVSLFHLEGGFVIKTRKVSLWYNTAYMQL